MPQEPDGLNETLEAIREHERERRQEYADFRQQTSALRPLEKTTAWLRHIAEHREYWSDLEAVVFLASRGQDVTRIVAEIVRQWKDAERETLRRYNDGISVVGHSGQKLRRHRPTPIAINDVQRMSRVILHDFWGGTDEQEFTIDATMLRAVEWCQIGGFDHWWQRLATETTEDVVRGGTGEMVAAFWLFAMCRSDFAIKMLSVALPRCFEAITIPRIGATLPWQERTESKGAKAGLLSDNMLCASAIIFAAHRLHLSASVTNEAVLTLQRHYDEGAWPVWSHDPNFSIEATAMAVHAIALARPIGWKRMLAGARTRLLSAQNTDGHWNEAGSPDPVFLTVLVMDALSLTSVPAGQVTFRHDPHAPTSSNAATHRYQVAFSFPGEIRPRINAIASALAQHLGRDEIFYDDWYKGELARPNLDIYLQQIYHDRAELIVVVLCADYQQKKWCHLEWRAIRDLINQRHDRIMFLRVDDAPVEGVYPHDGYVDLRKHNDAEVAELILSRLR